MQAPATIQDKQHSTFQHWEECKNELRRKIPSPFFHTFIQPIQVLAPAANPNGKAGESSTEDEALLLSIPGEKLLKHVEARYYPMILGTLRDVRFQGQVSLVARKAAPEAGHSTVAPATTTTENRAGSLAAAPPDASRAFIPHPANRPAVEKIRNRSYPGSLALLSGPSGSGKTMLAREIVRTLNASSSKGEESCACYLSLETFLTEFSLACRTRETIEWRRALRAHSFIVIDDFQFIKGTAKKTQEELRNLIDEYESRGCKLLLCSDVDFNRLPLQADLKSRLYPGFRAELRWPDAMGRARILEGELQRLGVDSAGVPIEYLVQRITGDIRKITSAALRLRHQECAGVTRAFLPRDLDRILGDLYEAPAEIKPLQVLNQVAAFFQLETAAICGPAREKKYVLARHLTAYICVEYLEMKLTDTAALLGRKDHGSIIHARKKILELMEKDLFLKKQIGDILAALRINEFE